MLKKITTRLKNMSIGPFFNERALENFIDGLRKEMLFFADTAQKYIDEHKKVHKEQKKNFENLEKKIKHLEKRVKNLELKG